MKRLGISIYPEHASLKRNKEYIDLASRCGFLRIFTCLLSVNKPKEEIKAEFKELIDHAHQNDMEVILDVAPYVFDRLDIDYDDLSFFEEIHADGIRLDEGFDGHREYRKLQTESRLFAHMPQLLSSALFGLIV